MIRIFLALLISLSLLLVSPRRGVSEEQAPNGSLQAEIKKMSAGMSAKLPKEMRDAFAQGIEEVRQSGIAKSSLGVGERAPEGELIGAGEEVVSLSKLWGEGSVVLTFYRGGWCPYCNVQLKALERSLSQIENAGATLVAVAPEIHQKSSETVEKNTLSFLVLSDPDNVLARKFGIVFTLPEIIRPIYEERIGLASYNGNDKNELPLSATYLIDRQGIIRWVFRDADYKKRAEPSEIVAEVLKLDVQN